jgi:hypothetical protein
MVFRHSGFPVAIWIVCEPALADEELQYRAQWLDRFRHQPGVGERVYGTERTALAADKASQLGSRTLIAAARVKERKSE